VLFGDATGLGSPSWNLVPEPRRPSERKRVYVTTTASSMFSAPYSGVIIDYKGYNPAKVAWEFDIPARPSATAVVAMAGLYDSDTDSFEPFAMGIARGILVGPGEQVIGTDVVVNIPLDSSLLVNLDHPPALGTPGWDGPVEYTIRPIIDLGGEGAILMNGHGLPAKPPPALRPGTYRFEEGSESILLPAMAPLTGALADASYSFIAGAYSPDGNAPLSVRIERGVGDIHLPIEIGDWIGTPRPTDPVPDGIASDFAFEIAPEAPADGAATFHMHQFQDALGTQLLRVFARGSELRVPVPDLSGIADTETFPSDVDVNWIFYSIRVHGATFDQFNYRHLRATYWDAYAVDSAWVRFPQPSP
jgi:hypothetical protein